MKKLLNQGSQGLSMVISKKKLTLELTKLILVP